MSVDVDRGFAADYRRFGFGPHGRRRTERLPIVAAGCALMAASGVSLGGYLQTPNGPSVSAPALD